MPTAVVICPGRGTYNAGELGYLGRHFPDPALLARFDVMRAEAGQETLSELDMAERFSLAKHTRGDNASGLIYAASLGDFLSIDRGAIDIVAVTGNSMGWYTALACGGALDAEAGFRIANTMGTLMQQALIGGQTVYPWLDEDWVPRPERKRELLDLVSRIGAEPDTQLYLSIDLGGMLVLAGNAAGLEAFEQAVPRVQERFPLRLGNHAAFHTPMQAPVAEAGREALPSDLFGQPHLPLIDGRGKIWWPGASDVAALYDYTLGQQVTESYDFTHAVTVAAREFAPDLFIVLGPGTTLGGAVAQSLILAGWRSMGSKADFRARQADAPLLAAMGMPDQRAVVTAS
ncbi:ACP S-malonyltransferase [Croceibacterium aestuarii]|uniref:ACP S-malonyltransferase n=1 Tax=Croceibacterium aestuarii TaxID=3064139 RepID=UPI00272E5E95|nr:ACP S-malonyltransferase [Croceibacterium sp. D39]